MKTVSVSIPNKSYEIVIGKGILKKVGSLLLEKKKPCPCAIITNPTISALYGATVKESLDSCGFSSVILEVQDSETAKSLENAEQLYNDLIHYQFDRDSCIIALGGGVVGDLAGFVAATFLRGIDFVQVPTTLLAQVDSAIGGKVAVDLKEGKNLIGAFHQPILVLSDVQTLSSLPESEIRSGLAEVIKYGIIANHDLFESIEKNMSRIFSKDSVILEELVKQSSDIKAKVVSEDEKEQGIRAILNFGHTLGHALEAITSYQGFSHGEAITIGMVYASKLSNQLGMLEDADVQQIQNIIKNAGLPVTMPSSFDIDEVIRFMKHDKKVKGKRIRFILPKKIGKVFIDDTISEKLVTVELGKMAQ